MKTLSSVILLLLLASTRETPATGGDDKVEMRIEGDFVVVTSKEGTKGESKPFEFRVPLPRVAAKAGRQP